MAARSRIWGFSTCRAPRASTCGRGRPTEWRKRASTGLIGRGRSVFLRPRGSPTRATTSAGSRSTWSRPTCRARSACLPSSLATWGQVGRARLVYHPAWPPGDCLPGRLRRRTVFERILREEAGAETPADRGHGDFGRLQFRLRRRQRLLDAYAFSGDQRPGAGDGLAGLHREPGVLVPQGAAGKRPGVLVHLLPTGLSGLDLIRRLHAGARGMAVVLFRERAGAAGDRS